MKTIALTDKSDIVIENNTLKVVSGLDALIQRVENKLLLYRGEYHLDTSAGMPWMQDILTKPDNLPALEGYIIDAVSEVDGVLSVSVSLVNEGRAVSVSMDVETTFGKTSIGVSI